MVITWPMENYEPLKFKFFDDDVLPDKEGKSDWCTIYFDGVVNVRGN